MKRYNGADFLKEFSPSVYKKIMLAVEVCEATHVAIFQNQNFDSSSFGATAAVCVGPTCTYPDPEFLKGKWLGDMPSQRKQAVGYVPVPDLWTAYKAWQENPTTTFEVIVGNIGMVYSGPDKPIAQETYNKYVSLSQNNEGRGGMENVTIFQDGDPILEFVPELDNATWGERNNINVFFSRSKPKDGYKKGYYWVHEYPGCMPEGDPNGPFPTEKDAWEDARNDG